MFYTTHFPEVAGRAFAALPAPPPEPPVRRLLVRSYMDIAAGYISKALQATVFPAGTDPTSLPALYLTYYLLLGFGGLFFYLSIASMSYYFFFRLEKDKFYPGSELSHAHLSPPQIINRYCRHPRSEFRKADQDRAADCARLAAFHGHSDDSFPRSRCEGLQQGL